MLPEKLMFLQTHSISIFASKVLFFVSHWWPDTHNHIHSFTLTGWNQQNPPSPFVKSPARTSMWTTCWGADLVFPALSDFAVKYCLSEQLIRTSERKKQLPRVRQQPCAKCKRLSDTAARQLSRLMSAHNVTFKGINIICACEQMALWQYICFPREIYLLVLAGTSRTACRQHPVFVLFVGLFESKRKCSQDSGCYLHIEQRICTHSPQAQTQAHLYLRCAWECMLGLERSVWRGGLHIQGFPKASPLSKNSCSSASLDNRNKTSPSMACIQMKREVKTCLPANSQV